MHTPEWLANINGGTVREKRSVASERAKGNEKSRRIFQTVRLCINTGTRDPYLSIARRSTYGIGCAHAHGLNKVRYSILNVRGGNQDRRAKNLVSK